MTKYEKMAWFNLAVIAGTIVILGPCMLIMGPDLGYSTATTLGPIGFVYGAFRFLRKKGTPRSEPSDERDEAIVRKALFLAGAVFICVVLVVMTLLSMFGGGNVPPGLPFDIAQGAFYLFVLTLSILILLYYRKGTADA